MSSHASMPSCHRPRANASTSGLSTRRRLQNTLIGSALATPPGAAPLSARQEGNGSKPGRDHSSRIPVPGAFTGSTRSSRACGFECEAVRVAVAR